MVQRFSILLISFFCLHCASGYSTLSESPFVYYEFDIPSCIAEGQDIPICLTITNRNDKDVIINSWASTFYFGIYDTCFVPIPSKIREEKVAPSYPKFVVVKKNSSIRMCVDTERYANYDFRKGQSYIIQAKYRNTESATDTLMTCLGEIGPYMHTFKVCK